MRILVVEDDTETSSYITQGFLEEGHLVETLADGRDGLSQAMSEAYDILVVDGILPGLEQPVAGARTPCARSGNRCRWAVPRPLARRCRGGSNIMNSLDIGGDALTVRQKPFAFSEGLDGARQHAGAPPRASRGKAPAECCAYSNPQDATKTRPTSGMTRPFLQVKQLATHNDPTAQRS